MQLTPTAFIKGTQKPAIDWLTNNPNLTITRLFDGRFYRILGDQLLRSTTANRDEQLPPGFIGAENPEPDGRWRGWCRVQQQDSPAWAAYERLVRRESGIYTLVGPGVNNNREGFHSATLLPIHRQLVSGVGASHASILSYLKEHTDVFGLLFFEHAANPATHIVRMAKITRKDLNLAWQRELALIA